MKKIWNLFSVLIVAALFLSACGTAQQAAPVVQAPANGTPTPAEILSHAGLSPVSTENVPGGGVFYALAPAMTWDMARNTSFSYSIGTGVGAAEIEAGLISLAKFGLVGLTAADLGFVIYLQSQLPATSALTAQMQIQAIAAPEVPEMSYTEISSLMSEGAYTLKGKYIVIAITSTIQSDIDCQIKGYFKLPDGMNPDSGMYFGQASRPGKCTPDIISDLFEQFLKQLNDVAAKLGKLPKELMQAIEDIMKIQRVIDIGS